VIKQKLNPEVYICPDCGEQLRQITFEEMHRYILPKLPCPISECGFYKCLRCGFRVEFYEGVDRVGVLRKESLRHERAKRMRELGVDFVLEEEKSLREKRLKVSSE